MDGLYIVDGGLARWTLSTVSEHAFDVAFRNGCWAGNFNPNMVFRELQGYLERMKPGDMLKIDRTIIKWKSSRT